MTPKSRKGLPLLTMFSTFCSFDAGFPHLCAVKARKGAVAPFSILVQQSLFCIMDKIKLKKGHRREGSESSRSLANQ